MVSHSEADAAFLRECFDEAGEEWNAIFSGRVGKLPANYRMPRDCQLIQEVWFWLCRCVREKDGGMFMLQQIQMLRDEVYRLECEVARLAALTERPVVMPDYYLDEKTRKHLREQWEKIDVQHLET